MTVIKSKNGYALLKDSDSSPEPWVVVANYDAATQTWACGWYFKNEREARSKFHNLTKKEAAE